MDHTATQDAPRCLPIDPIVVAMHEFISTHKTNSVNESINRTGVDLFSLETIKTVTGTSGTYIDVCAWIEAAVLVQLSIEAMYCITCR